VTRLALKMKITTLSDKLTAAETADSKPTRHGAAGGVPPFSVKSALSASGASFSSR